MGAVQSFLAGDDDQSSSSHGPASTANQRHRASIDHHGLSWVSTKLHRDMAQKFSELELLSLRQVLQQLQDKQDKQNMQDSQDGQDMQQSANAQSSTEETTQIKKDIRPLPGITEATFVDYLGLATSSNRTGHLFFRSFYNLSVYPDNPDQQSGREPPRNLTQRDFIKPLALYCHKVNEDMLMDVKPLKAIFESFAEPLTQPLTQPTPAATGNENPATDSSAAPVGQIPLQRSKTMEDSLRDLTLHTNFEWNPEDEDAIDVGPKVKAQDLVDIIEGLFWLIEQEVQGYDDITAATGAATGAAVINHIGAGSHRHRATVMVEHLVEYSKTTSHVHAPVDLASELVDYNAFSKYVSRNTPNIFEILSQYFYSLFLIGNTLRPTEAATAGKLVLPGISPIPALSSPSTILSPQEIALISWFIPLKKTTPTLTKLYAGSQNGFSMNQFEVHVCKYPAPTLLLLLVERQKTATPTMNRRQSISFGSSSSRHRHSINNNSPPYAIPWGVDSRKSSFEKLTGRSPTTPVSTGSTLSTIFDGVPTTADPIETQENTSEATPPIVTPRKAVKERLILGAYVTETWKVSKAGWGNDSFALFELSPCFEVFPAKKTSPSATPLSSTTKGSPPPRSLPIRTSLRQSTAVAGTAGAAINTQNRHYIHFLKNAGVGFGGQESESCLLYMDDNLRYGSYRQDFAGGNVYMSAGGARQSGFEVDFEVVECEVWGLGGPDAKARQQKEWDFEQREANRRASIHLRGKDGEQDVDRDLLEMAGVIDPDRGHRHARRQSAV